MQFRTSSRMDLFRNGPMLRMSSILTDRIENGLDALSERLPGDIRVLVDSHKILSPEDIIDAAKGKKLPGQRMIGGGFHIWKICRPGKSRRRQDELQSIRIGCLLYDDLHGHSIAVGETGSKGPAIVAANV